MATALLISPTAKPGGAERAFVRLGRHLPRFGVDVDIVLLESGPVEDWLAAAGCPYRVIPAGRLRQLPRTARTVEVLRRLSRRLRADVIVSNQSKGHIYGGAAAVVAAAPSIWWQQGVPGNDRFNRVAALVPAAAIVCSSDAAIAAQRRLTPRRSIFKVHLGIAIAEVAAARGKGKAIRSSLGWSNHAIVGIVGRLQRWKGQAVFLHAAARLAKEHPHLRFVVVGGAILGWEGSYPQDLRELAQALGLTGRVHFAGHQENVYEWFDAIDVVVHASVGEAFGLVVTEAMALGKPVVAAADGGPLEIIRDGESGMLVPPNDPAALATAVSRILGDPPYASMLSRGAVLRARELSDEEMTRRFAKIIERVVNTSDSRMGRPWSL